MTVADLQSRVASLEREVMELKQQVATQKLTAPKRNWFNDIWGMYKGDRAFKEAARLGRKWRAAQGPKTSRSRKASK